LLKKFLTSCNFECDSLLGPLFGSLCVTPVDVDTVSSEGLRDTLKRVSIVNSTSSPLSWGETTPDAQLPAVDLSSIQRMPRQRFTETDVSADAQVSDSQRDRSTLACV
jgi:hypothetical protein